MNNKVLVKLIAIEMNKEVDCFIPINEKIYNIKKIFLKYIFDVKSIQNDAQNAYVLLNSRSGIIYNNNDRVINTDIRNGSVLIIMQDNTAI